MPLFSAMSSQNHSTTLPSDARESTAQRALRILKTCPRARFAAITGLSFAVALPMLGILDPEVLLASGKGDFHTFQAFVLRTETSLRNMAVVEQLMAGCVAALTLAAMAGMGYLRVRYKEARAQGATAR